MNNKYFGNANTRVTVNEYGTSFGKDVKGDKDAMPMAKSRLKSAEEKAALTESFNMFKESNKGVDMKRLEELKNQRLTEKVMTEGYASLKDELFKDIMRQVCIEAMLVDEDVVLENVKVITDMVDNEVDRFGGFNALKDLVARTHNNLLESMVDMINEQAKIVGDRVLNEAKDCATSKDLFKTTDDEMLKFHNAKKDVGIDDVAEFVKDRVLTVVQGEQQAQEEKGAVIDEIKEKLSNAKSDVPVEEALTDIFDDKGLEELTLFESLMRKSYKNLLESQSSAIFESADFCEDEDCDDEEFDLDDLDIDDSDDDDEDPINDEFKESTIGILVQEGLTIETAKIFLKHVNTINNALEDGDTETLQEATQDLAAELEDLSEACGNKKKAKEMKEACRKIQKCTTDVVDASCAKGKAKALVEEEDGEYCTVCGQDPCVCELMREENEDKAPKEPAGKSESLEEGRIGNFFSKIINAFDMYAKQQLAVKVMSDDLDAVKAKLTNFIYSCEDQDELVELLAHIKMNINELKHIDTRTTSEKKNIKMYIDWVERDLVKAARERDKELERQRQERRAMRESSEFVALEEGVLEKVKGIFDIKAILAAKRDYTRDKKILTDIINSCKTAKELEVLRQDGSFDNMSSTVNSLQRAARRHPDKAAAINDYISWLKNDLPKIISDKEKELKSLKESMEGLEEGARLDAFREKIRNFFEKQLAKEIANRDFEAIRGRLIKFVDECKSDKDLDYLLADNKIGIKQLEDTKKRFPDSAEKIDKHIAWLKSEYVKLIAEKRKEIKSLKESMEGLEEGARLDNFRAKVQEFFEKQLSKNIAKQDFDAVRERFIKFIDACKNEGDVDYLLKDSKIAIQQLENAKRHYPEAADKIEKHIKWIKGDCVKLLNEKRKEVKKASTLKEGLITRTMSDDKLKAKIASKEKALNEIINDPYYDSADKGAQLAVGAIKDELNKLKKELNRRSNKRNLTEAEEIALEELEVELTEKFGVTKVQDFIQNKIYKKIATMDMEKEQGKMLNAINKAKQPKELEDFMKEIDQDIQDISKAKTRHPDQAAKLDAHAQWLRTKAKKLCGAKIKELKSQTIKESFDLRLDKVCDRLNDVVDRHDEALNLALESLNVNYDGNSVCAPMITAKDCNLNNLEMAYKVKVVCESLRSLSERCESDEDKKQLGVMIDKNLGYLAEARQLMGESSPYKSKLLVMAENYLSNLNSANLLESSNVALEEAAKVVEDVYKYVETHSVLEETSNDFMDVVMAEAIVHYTIMEAFSTMNLVTYNSEEIRKMAKKNIR